jgi:nitroreductase
MPEHTYIPPRSMTRDGDLLANMRAMRRLRPDPVPQELLAQLVEAATWAPNGANRQNFTYIIVTDGRQMANLASLWRRVVNFYIEGLSQRPQDTTSALQYDRMLAAMRAQRDCFADTPAVIVPCYQPSPLYQRAITNWRNSVPALLALGLRQSVEVLKNFSRWSSCAEAASIYPGVQNLLLAARYYGLGATITTWHLAFEADFKSLLGIPRRIHTFAIIPVGYPYGKFGPVRRRPLSDIVRVNYW